MVWTCVVVGWFLVSIAFGIWLGTAVHRLDGRDRDVDLMYRWSAEAAPPAERGDADQLPAVVAHGTLASLDVVAGALTTLQSHWDDLDAEKRGAVVARALDQVSFVSGLMQDFLHALPADANDALDAGVVDEPQRGVNQ
jgi:hypothetical protein